MGRTSKNIALFHYHSKIQAVGISKIVRAMDSRVEDGRRDRAWMLSGISTKRDEELGLREKWRSFFPTYFFLKMARHPVAPARTGR
jgi:hypothetical protein